MLNLSRLIIFLIMTSIINSKFNFDQIGFRANRFHPPEVQLFNQSNQGVAGSDLTHLQRVLRHDVEPNGENGDSVRERSAMMSSMEASCAVMSRRRRL